MPLLSDGEIRAHVAHHFGDLGAQAVETGRAIVYAESAGHSDALGDNYPRWVSNPDAASRYDRGLWQINGVHGYDADRLLSDPDYNSAAARAIFDLQGWGAWTSYRWGTYLDFYQEPTVPEPSPTPPMPSMQEVFLAVADVYYPAYDPHRRTFLVPARYETWDNTRFRVYELWTHD